MILKLNQRNNPKKGFFYDEYSSKNTSRKTVYFLGSYEGRPLYFYRFIKQIINKGYRVVYLQPSKQVLSVIHPEWLGESINQVTQIIKNDMSKYPENSASLIGVSLGSYLGLNVILRIQFEKFIAIAGGAPLRGVFRSSYLFKTARKKLNKDQSRYKQLDQQWEPFDEAFKTSDLTGTAILLLNSNKDEVITAENLEVFLKALKQTGAHIANNQKGNLPHIFQALSINWRVNDIETFINRKM